MNTIKKNIHQFLIALAIAVIFASCSPAGGEHPGDEYMPDMYHSIAYEANYQDYYYFNTWGEEKEYYKIAKPRKPVTGTVPRGYAGLAEVNRPEYEAVLAGGNTLNAISVPVNGSVPYPYENTEEERARATAEIIQNPFPITEQGLAKGKELYDIFCGICHGAKGNGIGYIVNEEENKNVKYPAQPANFLTDEFVNASNGRYYHAIMHGKNVMGAYPDKISFEERWQVIHYIRQLQAKDRKLTYNEEENSLNEVEIPGASVEKASFQLIDPEHINWAMIKGSHGHDDAHQGHGAEDHEHDTHQDDKHAEETNPKGGDHGEHAKDDHSEGH